MELRFLGTGPAVGIPRPGHSDLACINARKGGKSRRKRSSALLRDGRTILLVDAGPDVIEQLEDAGADSIDAVFLTHGHSDACGGLNMLNRWASRQSSGTKIPVMTDPVTLKRLQKRFPNLSCLQLIAIRPFDKVAIGKTNIIPFTVKHSPSAPTFGFLFGKKLAYASDLADIPAESQKYLRGVNTFVIDGTFYFGKKVLPSHLTTDEAIAWGRALNARRLFLTQIGHTYPPHAEAERRLRQYLREQKVTKPSVKLAYDGLTIRV